MDINTYISGVTASITNQTQKYAITAAIVGDALTSLATTVGQKIDFQISPTYSSIVTGTTQQLIQVVNDETNNGNSTLYFNTGSKLQWVITQDV